LKTSHQIFVQFYTVMYFTWFFSRMTKSVYMI